MHAELNRRTICIYHADCPDGFAAALALWLIYEDEIEYYPGEYQSAPPDVTDADVIMVDFSYKRDVLFDILDAAHTVLILDHHKSAAENLDGLLSGDDIAQVRKDWDRARRVSGVKLHGVFDMEKSGARLAWDFFHPGRRIPKLIYHIEDRDLWRFNLEGTAEINAYAMSFPFEFEAWHGIAQEMEIPGGMANAVREGTALLRGQMQNIHNMLPYVTRNMVIGGHDVPVANLPHFMASDAASILAQDNAFGATYYDGPAGRRFSLRSRGDDAIDVCKIAQAYGGGGHRNAAGFTVPHGWDGDD